ncbi:MAG: hypothetical protein ACMUHY_05250 [Thermoplasmatota archaeon]
MEASCPSCGTQVILRLPRGAQEGAFSVNCQDCGQNIDLEIMVSRSGKERIRINGKVFSPPSVEPSEPSTGKRGKVLVATEVEDDGDVEVRWGPDYSTRIRIAFFLLIIVGILGIASSIATVTSSFTIRDLEEQSPNDTVTFSVWVLDAATGRSLEGVDVSLRDGSYYVNGSTDNEGLVVLRNVRTGSLDMVLHHPEYKTTKGSVYISKGTPNVLDVPMERGSPSETAEAPLTTLEARTYSPELTNIMAIVMFLSSISAFISAFFVRSREFFTLAVIMAFLSIFSFGFLIGTLLSLAAVIIVINSYRGFFHNYELRMLLEEQGREDLKQFFMMQRPQPPQLPPVR